MDRGTKYLAGSTFRALSTLNARKPFAREGWASIPSFAFGLPHSELPLQHLALHAAHTAWAIARGAHRTTAGKLGLVLSAGSAAGLYGLHKRSADAERIVDRALADELGSDHHEHASPSPMAPSRADVPLFPTDSLRRRYVGDRRFAYDDYGRRTTLDVWRRADLPLDGKAPVMVQVHGGGWVVGDQTVQGYPLMSHLVERGWVCVSTTYRLSPRSAWPHHIVDVKRALGWVKDNIADHGGDPDWVGITGGSAGGHLCSLAALTPNDPQFQPGFEDADTSVKVCVPFYGVYDWTNRDGSGRDDILDFLERVVVKQPRHEAPEVFEQASSMTHVGDHAVPFMLLHGVNDSLVPVEQARSMVDLMRKESSAPVVYVEFPEAQHAFDLFGSTRTRAAIRGIEEFLNVVRTEA
ncbi:MAG: alpha/beta hydrolase [Acidimicrobiales bacterium]|nr:alpha/beta hydrolase [Acidimicrobiales bacterium]